MEPSKRMKVGEATPEEIEGFLHLVSPIKTSARNTKYFNAVFESGREEYHNTVVFSPEKHDVFSEAVKNGHPIRLCNVKKALSKFCLFVYSLSCIFPFR